MKEKLHRGCAWPIKGSPRTKDVFRDIPAGLEHDLVELPPLIIALRRRKPEMLLRNRLVVHALDAEHDVPALAFSVQRDWR